jgi:hypothetical protein
MIRGRSRQGFGGSFPWSPHESGHDWLHGIIGDSWRKSRENTGIYEQTEEY